MRPDKKLDKVEKKIEEIWENNIYKDITNDWIYFEADLCSSLYYHIRNFFKKNKEFENWRIIQQEKGRDFVIYEMRYNEKEKEYPLIYMECKHRSPDYKGADCIKKGFKKHEKEEIEKDLEDLLNNNSKKIKKLYDINKDVRRYFGYINFSSEPIFKCKKCGILYKVSSKVSSDNRFKCTECGSEGDPLWFFREFKKRNKYNAKLKVFYGYLLRPKDFDSPSSPHTYHTYRIPKELFGHEFI